jgi:succinyl-CoA synthetase beta subunit
VANGIVEARAKLEREVPMVVRIVGTNSEEARPILASADLITADSLDDAAAKAVAAAQAVQA